MFNCKRIFFSTLLYGQALAALAQHGVLTGRITDAHGHGPLAFSTVQLYRGQSYLTGTQSGQRGEFRFTGLESGRYRLRVTMLGYEAVDTTLTVQGSCSVALTMRSTATSIDEVVVTATEQKGMTSTSVIDRNAMEHLQPSSFADLMALLPGGMTSSPHTNQANVARLREVGISGSNYAVSSLGTKFLIDGVPVGTDANMQALGTAADASRNVTDYGVDMRNIPTDNIETVEVVRGIPSVKYGDLTSGLISIHRKRTSTPLEARFKTDEYGKLLSVGKGFGLRRNWVVNLDGGFFTSKADPRNKFETYHRINFSLRLHKYWNLHDGGLLYWDGSADYAGNIDNVKTDPEVQIHLEDKYKSTYHHGGLSSSLRYQPKDGSLLHHIALDYAANISVDKIDQTKYVFVDRDTHEPLSQENGEYDAPYLPTSYVTRYQVKGLPFYSNLRLEAMLRFATGPVKHEVSLGGEWQLNKNYGNGQVYDFRRPIDGSSGRKPRSFKDIPATDNLAAYLQDEASLRLGRHKLTLMAGVRTSTMMNVGKAFAVHGQFYTDPRFNLLWDLPQVKGWQVYLSAGWGRMSKMPTILDLYPEKTYLDFVQLNYWNKNDALKRCNIRTYTIDNNNYTLRPAHSGKWEVRLGAARNGHSMYVTYFHETMNDGFRTRQHIIPNLTYKRYDASAIDGDKLTAPPDLATLPYRTDTLLRTTAGMDNGTRIVKQGIEFQYFSPRIRVINTRLTVSGAWFHTTYTAGEPEYYVGSSQTVNGIIVSNRYIGLYRWKNGYVKDQFNTNITADTYFNRIGLSVSVTAECFWLGRTLTPSREARPVAYVDVNGEQHPYTDADARDTYLQWLMLTHQSETDDVRRDRAYTSFNLKATKRIGRNISISLYADRILNIAPDYEENGFIIRRVFTPYFGMELNFKI